MKEMEMARNGNGKGRIETYDILFSMISCSKIRIEDIISMKGSHGRRKEKGIRYGKG